MVVCISEKALATHSGTLAWRIPWTEEPGGLQSVGSRRVGHDWATSPSLFTFMHWRRKWQPTPVFLPGESQGQGSLVGCRLWGRTESDTTEATQQQQQQQCVYVTATLSVCSTFSFPTPGHKSILYICVSIPALQIGSSVTFFWTSYMCVNIWYLFFSFWLTSLPQLKVHGCSL